MGITCPILPGIMPIMTYAGFKRMTAFCKTHVPQAIMDVIESNKDNDEAIKVRADEWMRGDLHGQLWHCYMAAASRTAPWGQGQWVASGTGRVRLGQTVCTGQWQVECDFGLTCI